MPNPMRAILILGASAMAMMPTANTVLANEKFDYRSDHWQVWSGVDDSTGQPYCMVSSDTDDFDTQFFFEIKIKDGVPEGKMDLSVLKGKGAEKENVKVEVQFVSDKYGSKTMNYTGAMGKDLLMLEVDRDMFLHRFYRSDVLFILADDFKGAAFELSGTSDLESQVEACIAVVNGQELED